MILNTGVDGPWITAFLNGVRITILAQFGSGPPS